MALVRAVNPVSDAASYWLNQYTTLLGNLGYIGTDDSQSYITATAPAASKLVQTLPSGQISPALIPASVTPVNSVFGRIGNVVAAANDYSLSQISGIGGVPTAWVHFGYTGSALVIYGSFGVSGVVRNSVGSYTITFTTPYPNANYGMTLGLSAVSLAAFGYQVGTYTTTQCEIGTVGINSSSIVVAVDVGHCTVAFFGT